MRLPGTTGVISVGGGAVLDQRTRQLLAGRSVVYLETGFAAAAKRVGLDQARPLLAGNPRARLRQLLEQRLPIYQELALDHGAHRRARARRDRRRDRRPARRMTPGAARRG